MMTVGQMRKVMKAFNYVIFRYYDNRKYAVNSKIVLTGKRNSDHHGNEKTKYVSWKPCSLSEYITYKIPYV